MPRTIAFLFDFGSPNAYLSHLVIPGIEKRQGVKFDYLPVLLGGVFKATGNASPVSVPSFSRAASSRLGGLGRARRAVMAESARVASVAACSRSS